MYVSPDTLIIQSRAQARSTATNLSSLQRSLLCELELKAEWRGRSLDVSALNAVPGVTATIHSFERRLGGVQTGIRDAIVLLPDGAGCFDAEALAARAAATLQADLATVRIVGTGSLPAHRDAQFRRIQTEQGCLLEVFSDYYDISQVLRLEATFEAFLTKLGRGTRRNVEACLSHAARLGMRFRFVPGDQPADAAALSELARHNMPRPVPPRQMAGARSLIARQCLPFHASLAREDGRLVSAAGGFIDGPLACLLYQCNHGADRDLGPSLIMRSMLTEQLIALRVREIAFVGGCSGVIVSLDVV